METAFKAVYHNLSIFENNPEHLYSTMFRNHLYNSVPQGEPLQPLNPQDVLNRVLVILCTELAYNDLLPLPFLTDRPLLVQSIPTKSTSPDSREDEI